jgi:hypothetical protein
VEPIKSIAIPTKRRSVSVKPRRAGHPKPMPEHQVGGMVGPARRLAVPFAPAHEPRYQIGEQLMLRGGGNHWARVPSICRVIALLPHENGPFLYRVRSELESYERVVAEIDLSPAS